jgi:hypothetical protein
MAADWDNCVGDTYHANFWLAEMSKNSHQNNSSISLSHTISKSAVCQPKLTNVYQLDEEKTDLKKSRVFELEWVVQIQFIGQWSQLCFTRTGVNICYAISQKLKPNLKDIVCLR